ncbi:MAG: hypothetical protein RJB01_86, partial [Actinomycetota bacterium]
QMDTIAELISRAVRDADGAAAGEIAAEVRALVTRYPAYPRDSV